MDLTAKALRCLEIKKILSKETNEDEANDCKIEYFNLVREIRLDFMMHDLPEINDDNARDFLRDISSYISNKENHEIDPVYKVIDDLNHGWIDPINIEELSQEYFGLITNDYYSNLYEISVLIISSHNIPPYLRSYLQDLRMCYASEIYIGTIVLCRTVIEICINDLYHKKLHLINNNNTHIPRSETSIKLKDLINEIFPRSKYCEVNKTLHKIRNEGNQYVHPVGRQPQKPTKERVKDMIISTISIVQDLYTEYEEGNLF